jgi:DNA (cytosine-5)-methyltransferase 1
MKHGSIFSGVGGFDLAADACDIKTVWQCEIDSKNRSVLKKNWSETKRYVDITDVYGSMLEFVDIISFGSPCQDLSVAGKQKGVEASRSGLFFEATRVIEEMLRESKGKYPRFVVWENVKGSLTSNRGDDFEKVLEEMERIGAKDIAWRILDASDFGVPQRRERVFLVADFAGRCAGKILFRKINEGWDIKKGREKKQKVAREFEEGSGEKLKVFVKSRRAHSKEDYETWLENKLCPTLNVFDNANEIYATALVVDKKGVRKLTPIECERLMGYPDNHTEAEGVTEYTRYRMCGNGVATPVAKWVFLGVKKYLKKSC